MKALSWWPQLEASCGGRVALVDGDAMFNRPGPRLVDAYEWLVATLQATPPPCPISSYSHSTLQPHARPHLHAPTHTPPLPPSASAQASAQLPPSPSPLPSSPTLYGCRHCRMPRRLISQSSGSPSARGRRRRQKAHPTESSGFAQSWRRRRRSWWRRSRAWWPPSRRCTCARSGRASTRTRTPRPATTRVDMCAECHVQRGPVRPNAQPGACAVVA